MPVLSGTAPIALAEAAVEIGKVLKAAGVGGGCHRVACFDEEPAGMAKTDFRQELGIGFPGSTPEKAAEGGGCHMDLPRHSVMAQILREMPEDMKAGLVNPF
mgnify:CR=1 FL=1